MPSQTFKPEVPEWAVEVPAETDKPKARLPTQYFSSFGPALLKDLSVGDMVEVKVRGKITSLSVTEHIKERSRGSLDIDMNRAEIYPTKANEFSDMAED